jgi:hypothetical protein
VRVLYQCRGERTLQYEQRQQAMDTMLIASINPPGELNAPHLVSTNMIHTRCMYMPHQASDADETRVC